MRLTIVGCTGSMSGPQAAASSYLLQAVAPDHSGKNRVWNLLFDLGPGAYGQLWNYIKPTNLDALVLSHLHADHCADMISLQVFQRWAPCSSGRPLPVFGPAGLEYRLRQLEGDMEEDFTREFILREVSETSGAFEVGPFSITPYLAWHPVPAFGYRVEGPAGFPTEDTLDNLDSFTCRKRSSFAYTGDTDYCPSIEKMARGVDLLLSEAGFLQDELVKGGDSCRGVHMSAEMTGKLAHNANVGALVGTHIQPWTDYEQVRKEIRRHWAGELFLASAGAKHVF
ncbi:MBL fold metallo-hydrolase [Actinomycetaceae bacterium TAE3-ERU4]|nr:MBL fold metallo-hydrolase [Actinomycetaceae bacterium TAE3-ERU4]